MYTGRSQKGAHALGPARGEEAARLECDRLVDERDEFRDSKILFAVLESCLASPFCTARANPRRPRRGCGLLLRWLGLRVPRRPC